MNLLTNEIQFSKIYYEVFSRKLFSCFSVHLQTKLAEYVWSLHPNITLVRLPDRQGLIRARLYGAHVATGEVIQSTVSLNLRQPR